MELIDNETLQEMQESAIPLEEEHKGFQVTDIGSAEWCLKKIAEKEKEKSKLVEEYTAYMNKIQETLTDNVKSLDSAIEFFKGKLLQYALQQLEGTKKRSVKLPSGTLSFSKSTTFERDEAKMMAYFRENCPEFIKVKESPDWSGFKAHLMFAEDGSAITQDGEKLDFVKKVETDKFYVKV